VDPTRSGRAGRGLAGGTAADDELVARLDENLGRMPAAPTRRIVEVGEAAPTIVPAAGRRETAP
jgi:hypothetical protein